MKKVFVIISSVIILIITLLAITYATAIDIMSDTFLILLQVGNRRFYSIMLGVKNGITKWKN